MRYTIFFLLIFLSSVIAIAQTGESEYKVAFDKQYEENIKKERINGRYIPKDMEDAHLLLDQTLDDEVKAFYRTLPDSTAAKATINGIGPWILKNWNLFEGSRISHHLKTEKKIHHPVDMVYYILQTYYRYMMKLDIPEEPLLKYIQDRRIEIFKQQVMDREIGEFVPDSTGINK